MKNYFKKFNIMFIMLLVVIGVGAIQGGNAVNAATIGQQLLQPEDGWRRFQEYDGRINYSKGWTDYTINGSLGLSEESTASTDKPYFSFKFYGTKLRLMATENTDHSSNIQVSIDGDNYTYSQYSSSLVRNVLWVEKEGLPLQIHTVKVQKMNTDSTWITLDAIDIDNTGYLVNDGESITLNKSNDNLQVGQTDNLVATTTPAGATVTWTSSDSNVATVDSTGKVTGLKEGQSTITATTADGLTATCVVTVTPKTAEPTNPDPDPTDSEKIVNIAHAKGDNTNNAGGDVTIIFHGSTDTTLSVVKTADVKDVWVGDNFTYTIVVTNTGTKTAKAVVVNDPAPNHIDFVVNGITTTQGTVDPSSTSKNIIVNVGDIAPGATVTIKVPATVIL